MATKGFGDVHDSCESSRGRRLPLNSKLIAAHLRQLNEALELPTTGSADEFRQQFEGHLVEREDPNVQVVI